MIFGTGTITVSQLNQTITIIDDINRPHTTGQLHLSTRQNLPQIRLTDATNNQIIDIRNANGILQIDRNVQLTGANPALSTAIGNTLTLDSDLALSLNTSNNAPITTGAGLFTFGGNIDVQGGAQFGTGNVNLITLDGRIAAINANTFADLNGSALTNLNEVDPEVGNNATDFVPRWDGAALVTGTIYDPGTGNVGIGTTGLTSTLTVAGRIESTTGGIMFPDGTTQTTAAGRGTLVYTGHADIGRHGTVDVRERVYLHFDANPSSVTLYITLTMSVFALDGNSLAGSLKDNLIENGFENVSLILEDSRAIVTYENRMYRDEIRAAKEVIGLLTPQIKEKESITLIPQNRKIPLVAITIPADEYLSFLNGKTSDEKFASALEYLTFQWRLLVSLL